MDTPVTSMEGRDQKLAELVRHLARAHELAAAGELAASEDEGRWVLLEAQAAGERQYIARALRQLAHVAVLRGDYLTCNQRLHAALEIALELGDNRTGCMCHYALARQMQMRGQLAAAEGALGEALMFAQRGHHADLEGMVYLEYAICRMWLGQLEDALTYAQEALTLFREAGDADRVFYTLTVAADAADHLGATDLATACLAEAAGMTAVPGYANVMCGAWAESALRDQARQLWASAAEHIAAAEAQFDERCDFDTAIPLYLARGRQLDHTGAHDQAIAEYFAAQHLAQLHQSRCHIAWIRLERVPGLIALGALDKARAVLLDAELAFELFDAQINLGRTFCAWAHYFSASNNYDGAAAAVDRAEAIATRLGTELGLHLAADLQRARVLARR